MLTGGKQGNTRKRAIVWTAVAAAVLTLGITSAKAQDQNALYGAQGITPQAVVQGTLGSCYFHAAIAALAHSEPGTLRGMIGHSFLGAYKVHFASGPDEVVFNDDVQYGRMHHFDQSEGDWVLVLMRGYAQRTVRQSLAKQIEHSTLLPGYMKPIAAQWLNQSGLVVVAYDRAVRSVINPNGAIDKNSLKQALTAQLTALHIPAAQAAAFSGFLDEKEFFDALASDVRQNGEIFGAYQSIGQGGDPARVLAAIKGKSTQGMTRDREQLVSQLNRVHQGSVAMAAAAMDPSKAGLFAGSNWFVAPHAYTVLDYDPSNQMVTLRNPWGHHPDPNGNFSIPLNTFAAAYEYYAFAE